MSPHTDAGALLKLIDGIEKRAFDIPASNLVTPQIVQMCIAARNILTRQAASQGSAGGERSEVRSEVVAWQKRRNDYARGEWIQVLPEHVDEAKSRRWQVRPLYAAPQPAIVAQARQERHEATYLRGWNEGIECAVEALEKEGWYTPQDTIRKLVEESPVPSASQGTEA